MSDPFWATAASRLDGSAHDGIHLLWAPPFGAGYSVRGFDIQRRAWRYRREEVCVALTGAELDLLHRRLWFVNALATISVNRTACPAWPPRLPDEPFTGDPSDDSRPMQCINFRRLKEGPGPNPLVAQGARFTRFDHAGAILPTSRLVRTGAGLRLDCAYRLQIDLPDLSDEVQLTLLHASRPAKIAALDRQGAVVDTAVMTAGRNVWETLTLRGAGIALVAVSAPQDETFLLSFCYALASSRCVGFQDQKPGEGPNPRLEQRLAFEVFDGAGRRAKATVVRRVGGLVGLDCGAVARVRVDDPDSVDVTLLALEGAVVVTAYARDRRVAGRATLEPGTQPQMVRLRGPRLVRIEIAALKRAEALLLALCVETAPPVTAPKRLELRRMQRLTAGMNLAAAGAVSRTAVPGCLRYRIALRGTHRLVRVEIGVNGVFAIARREGKTVVTATSTSASGLQTVAFSGRPIDEVLLYVSQSARSLRICVDRLQDPAAEEQEWAGEAFIARGIQLPVRSVNGALVNAAAELALAISRLLPGEAIAAARFREVTGLLNEVAGPASLVSPVLRSTRTREREEDPFVELRSWAYALSLLASPGWRRALGFGFFDRGTGLVAGSLYDYRITGHFRRRDLEETVFGFHTVPSNTALPAAFYLGIVRLSTRLPATVEILPAPAALALRGTGRKGLRLSAAQRVTLTFPVAIQRLVLELEPIVGHALSYRARTSDYIPGLSGATFQAAIPATRRVAIDFMEPVDTVELRDTGFLYAIRFEGGGDADDVIAASVVIPGIRYESTAPPDPPAFLGTVNLQQPAVPGDPAVTTRTPPQPMGFTLSWVPPPVAGPPLTPWPPDLDAGPPFEVLGFHLERRRVDVPTAFNTVDDDPEPTMFVGNRGSRSDPPPLADGVDLLEVFPEVPRPVPPVSPFMTADDVLVSAEVPGPPPGSRHQYRISSVDVLGRQSTPRIGSIVRLEKRRPPPQPVASETVLPEGVIVPPGVRARALLAADPDLTAADLVLLGASSNAIVLEWGWTQQERDRDPHAREFRVYWQPEPPDVIAGELTGIASLSAGQWSMTAAFSRAVAANAMQGRFVRGGGRPFRVASHDAGFSVTMNFDLSAIDPAAAPVAGRFEFRPRLDGSELRPGAWAERVGVVPITAGAPEPFVLRDRLVLDAIQPRARVWVGVSAADDQAYIPDEIPAMRPNGGRPGNESSIASVAVEARYLGRPTLVVPPPLPAVPEQVTLEPAGETVPAVVDLPALLPAVAVPAGHTVLLERLSSASLLTLIGATADDRIGVTFPGGTTASYALGNPADQAAFLEQIRTGTAGRVEGRFVMDFLLRFPAELEPLWRRALGQAVAWGATTDVLPGKPERHIHRVRLVDQAGHVSSGAGIVPQIVRVASLRVPRAPELAMVADTTDEVAVSATVTDMYDLRWIVLFSLSVDATAPLDDRTLAKAQLLRLPDRRDLYPTDGMRLRLADGTLLVPAAAIDLIGAGAVAPPNRSVQTSLSIGFDRRVAVWAVTLTRDGIPSRFAGPRVALTGPTPLVVPALTVVAGTSTDDAAWSALAVSADVALERSVDAGASWSRVSPWLVPTTVSYSAGRTTVAPRLYRLALRASRNRSVVGTGVALP